MFINHIKGILGFLEGWCTALPFFSDFSVILQTARDFLVYALVMQISAYSAFLCAP